MSTWLVFATLAGVALVVAAFYQGRAEMARAKALPPLASNTERIAYERGFAAATEQAALIAETACSTASKGSIAQQVRLAGRPRQ